MIELALAMEVNMLKSSQIPADAKARSQLLAEFLDRAEESTATSAARDDAPESQSRSAIRNEKEQK